MKNAKKLIVASVLSMMTASCYAGSIVAGSEQKKVQWILVLFLLNC